MGVYPIRSSPNPIDKEEATPCVVFDLDGTLCDVEHRRAFALSRKWDQFHAGIPDDLPRVAESLMMQALASSGIPIVIMTGRPARYMPVTLAWLAKWHLPEPEHLMMRGDTDHRPSSVVKDDMISYLIELGYEITAVFEDQSDNATIFRSRGITCFQTQEGSCRT